jgi:hypothetical protein
MGKDLGGNTGWWIVNGQRAQAQSWFLFLKKKSKSLINHFNNFYRISLFFT